MPWFQRGDGHLVLVPDHMPDTVERVRREHGWQEVPDPRPAPVSPETETETETETEQTSSAATARRGGR